jgi:hypothetical protein
VVFHGHAHHGTFRGTTPGGVPVFNVSHVLLRDQKVGEMYFLYDIELPHPDAVDQEPPRAAPATIGSAG